MKFLGSSTCPLSFSFSAILSAVYGFAGYLCGRVDGTLGGETR